MNLHRDIKKFDVVILCGGLGTRLRTVISDRPKALISIGVKSYLDLIAEKIFSNGMSRVIFSTGHLGGFIKLHIAKNTII